MTCRSCHWSIWHGEKAVLWCDLKACEANERCAGYAYEPGTDAEEHNVEVTL